MNLTSRVKRLESNQTVPEPLTEGEQKRLDELSKMSEYDPGYDILEYLELDFRTRPGLAIEEVLQDLEGG